METCAWSYTLLFKLKDSRFDFHEAQNITCANINPFAYRWNELEYFEENVMQESDLYKYICSSYRELRSYQSRVIITEVNCVCNGQTYTDNFTAHHHCVIWWGNTPPLPPASVPVNKAPVAPPPIPWLGR